MVQTLDGKVVAITGASSGIGEAVALACAAAGATVSLAARRSHRLDALVERIEGEGGKAVAMVADVSEEEQAQRFVAGTHEEFGRLDVLVNNAGVMLLGPVVGAPTEEWRRMIAVNVVRRPVLHARGAAADARAEIAATSSTSARWPGGSHRPERRLQPHEVRRRRVLGVAAPGGHRRPASG